MRAQGHILFLLDYERLFTDTNLRYFQTVNTPVLYGHTLHIFLPLIEVVCLTVYVCVCMYVRMYARAFGMHASLKVM